MTSNLRVFHRRLTIRSEGDSPSVRPTLDVPALSGGGVRVAPRNPVSGKINAPRLRPAHRRRARALLPRLNRDYDGLDATGNLSGRAPAVLSRAETRQLLGLDSAGACSSLEIALPCSTADPLLATGFSNRPPSE